MKTFNQFLQEVYLCEFVGTPPNAQQVAQAASKGLPKPGWASNLKTVGGRLIGPAMSAWDAYDEYGKQRARGRSVPASIAMGVTKAAGGLGGSALGGAVGAPIGAAAGGAAGGFFGAGAGAAPGATVGGIAGGVIGSGLGYWGGSELAGRAAETIAGSTGKEKAAAVQKNRQRQMGGGLAGIGGNTVVGQTKPGGPAFMSTGSGTQRRTVQLAKTSVVRNSTTGKLETGNLAFKTDPTTGQRQAVYKRAADPSTLARTSSNWLERVGRTISPGSYAAQDERVRQSRLRQAVRSDVQRQRALGVAGSKNLVGQKIVGQKIVGPKIVGPKKPTTPPVKRT